MSGLPDSEHEQVDRMLFDMFEDSIMSPAYGDKRSWIAEIPGPLWHDTIQGGIKTGLKLG